MPLTTVSRRSIIDVAGVLDTPLKLVTIERFKMKNPKIMSKATKIFICFILFIIYLKLTNVHNLCMNCTIKIAK